MAGSQISVLCAAVFVHLAVLYTVGFKVCPPTSWPHPQGICGNSVPRVLKLVCSTDGYAQSQFGKRSEVPSLTSEPDDTSALSVLTRSSGDLSDYYMNKREASFFLDKRAKVKITCECCYNKCSLRELTGYCRNPAKAYARFQHYGNLLSRLFR